MNIDLDLSVDKMLATICIRPQEGESLPSIEELKQYLAKGGINFGIDEKALQQAVNNPGSIVTIARGESPTEPIDGKVEYNFPLKAEIKPKEDKSGNVDYFDLGFVFNVKEGDLLATKTPPVEGKPGHDVTGKILMPKKPFNPKFVAGKGAKLSEDGLSIFAEVAGTPRLIEGKVVVLQTLDIDKDIDFATGNIVFKGSVNIRGSVLSGFSVEADGDVIISGIVEEAVIKAKGNVIIRTGFEGGTNGFIQAGKSVNIRFIHNGKVFAGEDVLVESEAFFSKITAGGKVLMQGRNSQITGGSVEAGIEIRARVIGSYKHTKTLVSAGVVPGLREKLEGIVNRIKSIEAQIKKARELEEKFLYLKKKQKDKFPQSQAEALENVQKTIESYINQVESLKKVKDEIIKTKEERKGGRIISDIIYPGVIVTIADISQEITEEIRGANVRIEEGELKFY
ncbi:protein of unknown function DUF342 [Thermodesulfobium narugense DSM 14796]|uniref:Flagellar Assembly Protein A N-terminal region domain-containing protein n=1 Tax=Thermodesulfobium narugense DSM 14796 TaxID=747365 RepID=M1E5B1_9BACT|nr:FapA family protein [Thermodesulfobium narugense]AEE13663.1 protein of unknown function DUF342 [Thermodesulfobium narugense DSM 14796]